MGPIPMPKLMHRAGLLVLKAFYATFVKWGLLHTSSKNGLGKLEWLNNLNKTPPNGLTFKVSVIPLTWSARVSARRSVSQRKRYGWMAHLGKPIQSARIGFHVFFGCFMQSSKLANLIFGKLCQYCNEVLRIPLNMGSKGCKHLDFLGQYHSAF